MQRMLQVMIGSYLLQIGVYSYGGIHWSVTTLLFFNTTSSQVPYSDTHILHGHNLGHWVNLSILNTETISALNSNALIGTSDLK